MNKSFQKPDDEVNRTLPDIGSENVIIMPYTGKNRDVSRNMMGENNETEVKPVILNLSSKALISSNRLDPFESSKAAGLV